MKILDNLKEVVLLRQMTQTIFISLKVQCLLIFKWIVYTKKIGPVGSNHGSLACARARGAGSPRTVQSLLLALRVLPDPDDEGHGVGRWGGEDNY